MAVQAARPPSVRGTALAVAYVSDFLPQADHRSFSRRRSLLPAIKAGFILVLIVNVGSEIVALGQHFRLLVQLVAQVNEPVCTPSSCAGTGIWATL